MILYELLQAYRFDEIMATINNMYPGTAKYRDQLRLAYDLLMDMRPVPSKKTIHFKVMQGPGDLMYMGAEDRDFNSTWEVCLGKNIVREKGVDLNNDEVVANCLVNICFTARHPKVFDKAFEALHQE